MQLAFIVVLVVLSVTAVMATVGVLIDRSAARHEKDQSR
jgi:hypothetical protein